MALTETFDTLEIVFGDIAFGASVPVHDERHEPVLSGAAPLFVEFDDPVRLDPDRIGLIWELPPPAGRSIRLRSPLVSLAVHFLPLLAIVGWASPAADIAPPIPVQLVFEPPPPPPPPQPQPKPPEPKPQPPPEPKLQAPPHGPLASVDMGDVKPKDMGLTTSMTPPAAGEAQLNPADTQVETATPPPLPAAKPAAPKDKSAFQLPKPAGAPVPHHEAIPHEAAKAAQFAGPAASRDEYLAYLVTLTRQHIDLLPLSVIGDRSGETVLSVVINDNGVIGPLSVVHSSGYPDIDQRIEGMVAAIHRAPPLPQWFQGNAMELVFSLKFPEALYQR